MVDASFHGPDRRMPYCQPPAARTWWQQHVDRLSSWWRRQKRKCLSFYSNPPGPENEGLPSLYVESDGEKLSNKEDSDPKNGVSYASARSKPRIQVVHEGNLSYRQLSISSGCG